MKILIAQMQMLRSEFNKLKERKGKERHLAVAGTFF
jgi:hypothetical protein